jgi:4-hydroxyphenylpyruvate dioxygenase
MMACDCCGEYMNDSLSNPMGTDGFEFVEYTAADPQLLRTLFESIELDPMRRGVIQAPLA